MKSPRSIPTRPGTPRRGPRWTWLFLVLALLLWGLPVGTVLASGPYRFQNVERVVAVGDIHGDLPAFSGLLQREGLVDGQLAWQGGRAHLVVTGDMIDRGDDSRAVLELLQRLQGEAAAAGGAVHVLLGNHELMALSGDLRYVSAGDYAAFARDGAADAPIPGKPPGYAQRLQAFAPSGRFGRWLLELPAVVVIDGTAFVHGGLSPKLSGVSLEQVNAAAQADARAFAEGWQAMREAGVLEPGDEFDAVLATARSLAQAPPAGDAPEGVQASLAEAARGLLAGTRNLAFHPDGPLWYRGNAVCHPYLEQPRLQPLLAGLGASRVAIGHTPTIDRRITSRLDGRVLRIDTGLNQAAYQGRPAALRIHGRDVLASYDGADRQAPREEAGREWSRPHGMSDAQLEDFLREARVEARETLELGVTRPERLTLERDGKRLHAVFKDLDTDPGIEQGPWKRVYEAADRYQYEVAAYRLDRLLGLDMVPVAVLREVDGRKGMVQYWVEDAIDESRRVAEKIGFEGDCPLLAQHNLMNVFDVLINNVDRNTGNILYDPHWQMWSIDHTRAFGTDRRRPKDLRQAKLEITPPLAAALERVTAANLAPLAPYLNAVQRQALVRRARSLRAQQ